MALEMLSSVKRNQYTDSKRNFAARYLGTGRRHCRDSETARKVNVSFYMTVSIFLSTQP